MNKKKPPKFSYSMANSPADEADPPSGSPRSHLRHLNELDMGSENFVQDLNSMLQSKHQLDSLRSLQGEDLVAFIDFLDRALDAIVANPAVFQRCLRSLRKLCGRTGQLPTSHIILNGLTKTGERPVTGGGFGDVWTGSYQELKVAIKSLRIYQTDEMVKVRKEFCKEVVVWKRLSHPNVLPFLGAYSTTSELWMVSEWMPHGNIVEYLRSHPGIDRLGLLLDAAKGLEYLHSSRVVHADLKGANIVVDKTGNARLADFGLTSIKNESLSLNASSAGHSAGTPRWMAPELLDPHPSTPDAARPTTASDIYAFAMVTIEVFSGQVPFHKINVHATIREVSSGRRPDRPKDGYTRGLSDDIWQLIQECWVADPAKRLEISTVVQRLSVAVSHREHIGSNSELRGPSTHNNDKKHVELTSSGGVSHLHDNKPVMEEIPTPLDTVTALSDQSSVTPTTQEDQTTVVYTPQEDQTTVVFTPPEDQTTVVFTPQEDQTDVIFTLPEALPSKLQIQEDQTTHQRRWWQSCCRWRSCCGCTCIIQ